MRLVGAVCTLLLSTVEYSYAALCLFAHKRLHSANSDGHSPQTPGIVPLPVYPASCFCWDSDFALSHK